VAQIAQWVCPKREAHGGAADLADDRCPGKAVNFTTYRRFCRDTQVLLYQDRDTRVIEVWPDELDHRHAMRAEH